MRQYLLSVHMVEGEPVPTEDVIAQMYARVGSFNQRLKDDGAWVFAGGLQPADTAAVVHIDGTDAVVTKGTAINGPKTLGGFWVINADDDAKATAWAEFAARACAGPVEVRPFQEVPEALPGDPPADPPGDRA